MTRTVVITGGAGFLGSHLADHALTQGWTVRILDNLLTGFKANLPPAAEFTEGDVRDPEAWDTVTRGGVDLICHLASPASPRWYAAHPVETMEANSIGTHLALRAAVTHGARLTFTSTSEVYGDPTTHPQVEYYNGNVNPTGPRAMYDEAKRYAEALISVYQRTHRARAGIVRLFNTYGPRMAADDGRVVPAFLRAAQAGQPLPIHGDGKQTRSLCYVTDTVRGIWAYAQSHERQPINLGNPEEVTMLDLAAAVSSAVGVPLQVRHEPPAPDDPHRRRPNGPSRQRAPADPGRRSPMTWTPRPAYAYTPGTRSRDGGRPARRTP